MTQEEIKILDKRIVAIQDPFGKGFASFRKIFQEMADSKGAARFQILHEYIDWKSSHQRF